MDNAVIKSIIFILNIYNSFQGYNSGEVLCSFRNTGNFALLIQNNHIDMMIA